MNEELKNKLQNLSLSSDLPEHDYLFSLAEKCSSVLENEITAYRPKSENGMIGGLIDFCSESESDLPLIIVPDIHARAYFLFDILQSNLPLDFVQYSGATLSVYEALEKHFIRIVCVGDLLHSELRGRARWLRSLDEFYAGLYTGPSMTQEMKEGLSLLCMVMELKLYFTDNFHVLKGNHENIMNERSCGNFPFRKFADEGEMVKTFMKEKYGEDVLMVISCFEKALPLIACSPQCVISHAEPAYAYSKNQLINAMNNDEIICNLTWTPNDSALDGSCELMLAELTKNPNALYFGGHRPINGTSTFRQGGKFVQIHNPEREFITLIHNDRPFDPDKDIIDVSRGL